MRSETSSLTVKMANFETFLIGYSGDWVNHIIKYMNLLKQIEL